MSTQARSSALAKLADGSVISLDEDDNSVTISRLEPHLSQLATLRLYVRRYDERPNGACHTFLVAPLAQLTHLELKSDALPNQFYHYDLSHEPFRFLETFGYSNPFYAPGDGNPLGARRDMMKVPSDPSTFSLAHFIYFLDSLPALRSLNLHNFLHVPVVDPYNVPSSYSGVRLPHLKDLKVQDTPNNINMLLTYLILPDNVALDIVARSGARPIEVDLLKDMLPAQWRYRNSLLLKPAMASVKVGSSIGLTGRQTAENENRPKVAFEVLSTDPRGLQQRHNRAQMLGEMLAAVPEVFDVSRLTGLLLSGDIGILGIDSWRAVLEACCNLRRLKVEEISEQEATSAVENAATSLFKVLEPSPNSASVVCPQLEFLHISNDGWGPHLVGQVPQCFSGREDKALRLKKLILDLRIKDPPRPSVLQTMVNRSSVFIDFVILQNTLTAKQYVTAPLS